MPFSRSRSMESMTRSVTSDPSRNAPVCHSIASTSVVFPWSTCATMATFRRSSRSGISPVYEADSGTLRRADSGVWLAAGAGKVENGAPTQGGNMNRGAGTGLMVLGVVLVVVGAILGFAVTVETTGFNINTIGTILLITGIVSFVTGIGVFFASSSRRTSIREDVRNTPSGRERIYEERDNLAS